MNAISHALAVAWKEIQLLAKDRGSLAVLFLLPLLLTSMYGAINLGLASDEEGAPILLEVALVNDDEGIFGEQIAKAIDEIEEISVEKFGSASEAEQMVREGNLTAAIIIPPDFTQMIDDYTPTAVEVIVDPAEPEGSSIVSGIVNRVAAEIEIWGEVQHGVRTILSESGALADASPAVQRAVEAQSLGTIMTTLNELRRSPVILVVSEDLEGVTVAGDITQFFALLYPQLAVMFVFFIVGAAAASLLGEKESGTLRRLLAAPMPRGAIISGKVLAYMLLVCLQVLVLFTAGSLVFDMPLGQSPVGLALLTLALGFVATAMGMMVAALAKTAKQADNLGIVVAFVLAAIGGCLGGVVPILRTEGFLSILAWFTPHAHALEGYYSLMAESASLVQVLPQIGILLGMGVVFFLIATWRFRFE